MYSKYSFGSGLFTNTNKYGRFWSQSKEGGNRKGLRSQSQMNSSQNICEYLRKLTRPGGKGMFSFFKLYSRMYTSAFGGVKLVRDCCQGGVYRVGRVICSLSPSTLQGTVCMAYQPFQAKIKSESSSNVIADYDALIFLSCSNDAASFRFFHSHCAPPSLHLYVHGFQLC